MDMLKIVLTSFGSLAALFFSTKIIGNKQMSQLNMFDYINGITIGSIAAEMATSLENIHYSVIAIAVYTAVIVLISVVTEKSVKLRRFLSGRSILLMQDGNIYAKNFKTAKIDINEFLTQCRVNGFFNIDDIETAVLEANGKISFQPKTAARPVNTKDLNLLLKEEQPSAAVILDGAVMPENLRYAGKNEEWLTGELERLKIKDISEIFIGICNDNELSAYTKITAAPQTDIFQ